MSPMIDPNTWIGAVTLSVADLDRSLAYYQQQIGLELQQQTGDAATLGVAGTPLLQLHAMPGARHVPRATGLYHFALRVPSRRALARVLAHFAETGTRLSGASDHLVSEALYLSDPDGHGIEIYRDRPRSTWHDASGNFRMDTKRLDIDGILGELQPDEPAWQGLEAGTDMGHIHLQVADIAAAERFYIDLLGFSRMASMPSASFISAGGYHHHIGMNTWAGVGVPPPPVDAARLLSYEVWLPSAAALEVLLARLAAADITPEVASGGLAVRDPAHNLVVLRATEHGG